MNKSLWACLLWHEVSSREGKGPRSWQFISMISFTVQHVPLMLISCCSHRGNWGSENHATCAGAGRTSSPLPSLSHSACHLTRCHTRWVQSRVAASSGSLPSSLSASLWVPRSVWAGGPGDHPLKCLLKVSWTTPGGQINCPWATYITLAYGNFASLKKKMPWKIHPSPLTYKAKNSSVSQ